MSETSTTRIKRRKKITAFAVCYDEDGTNKEKLQRVLLMPHDIRIAPEIDIAGDALLHFQGAGNIDIRL